MFTSEIVYYAASGENERFHSSFNAANTRAQPSVARTERVSHERSECDWQRWNKSAWASSHHLQGKLFFAILTVERHYKVKADNL